MTMISYGGRIAAVVTSDKVHFSEAYSALPEDHPDRRFAYTMGIYAADVAAGELAGPYTQHDAELYARTVLIPDDDFRAHADTGDQELAEFFGVPVAEIVRKRGDLERYSTPPAAGNDAAAGDAR